MNSTLFFARMARTIAAPILAVLCLATLMTPAAVNAQIVIDGTKSSTTVPKTDQQKMIDNKQRLIEMVKKRKEELARQTELRHQQEETKKAMSGAVKITSPPPGTIRPTTGLPEARISALGTPSGSAATDLSGASVAAGMILMMKPFNQTITTGERFLTEVCAHSQKDIDFDEIRISINYPRHDVKPQQVFDFPLEDYLDEEQPSTITNTPGLLTYTAKLKKPLTALGTPILLNIIWEGLRTTAHAELALTASHLPDKMQSGLFYEEVNILKAYSKAGNACIGASVTIAAEEDYARRKINVWTKGSADKPSDDIPISSQLTLKLLKPKRQPEKKGEFIIEVHLTNPHYLAFDELTLAIGFDKNKVKVFDWDYNGWVRRGINVFDGHAHEDFPFNIHTRNEVQNERGRITYTMGNSILQARPSGSLIRIHGKELTPGGMNSFTLFSKKQTDNWYTDIRADGTSLLRRPDKKIAATK